MGVLAYACGWNGQINLPLSLTVILETSELCSTVSAEILRGSEPGCPQRSPACSLTLHGGLLPRVHGHISLLAPGITLHSDPCLGSPSGENQPKTPSRDEFAWCPFPASTLSPPLSGRPSLPRVFNTSCVHTRWQMLGSLQSRTLSRQIQQVLALTSVKSAVHKGCKVRERKNYLNRVVIQLNRCRLQLECELGIRNWGFLSDPLMGCLLVWRAILSVKNSTCFYFS